MQKCLNNRFMKFFTVTIDFLKKFGLIYNVTKKYVDDNFLYVLVLWVTFVHVFDHFSSLLQRWVKVQVRGPEGVHSLKVLKEDPRISCTVHVQSQRDPSLTETRCMNQNVSLIMTSLLYRQPIRRFF